MEIFIHMNPPTVTFQKKKIGRSKTGKAYLYDSQELRDAIASIRSRLIDYVPDHPMEGPLYLESVWGFYKPEIENTLELRTEKPDADNSSKMLQDILADLKIIRDDKEVSSVKSTKFNVRNPKDAGIKIILTKIEIADLNVEDCNNSLINYGLARLQSKKKEELVEVNTIARDLLVDLESIAKDQLLQAQGTKSQMVRLEHAHWVMINGEHCECSNCRTIVSADLALNHKTRYCMGCGARMDEDAER